MKDVFARSRPGRPRYGIRQAPRRLHHDVRPHGSARRAGRRRFRRHGWFRDRVHGPLTGEDDVVICSNCDYAANIERATSTLPDVTDRDIPELERFPTPGVPAIKALEEIEGGAPAEHQIKTMVMVLDGQITLAPCAATIGSTSRNFRTPPARSTSGRPRRKKLTEPQGDARLARCGPGRGPADRRRPLALGPLRSHHRRQRGRLALHRRLRRARHCGRRVGRSARGQRR